MLGEFAPPSAAVDHFAARLSFETDPSDVHAASESGHPFALIDTRGTTSWRQGRIVGAIHMPTAEIATRATTEIPVGTQIVTYCWGPGCNGSTRAAREFARLGFRVKEMIGGFEYWAREGLPIETDSGHSHLQRDPLTGPVGDAAPVGGAPVGGAPVGGAPVGGDSTVGCDC